MCLICGLSSLSEHHQSVKSVQQDWQPATYHTAIPISDSTTRDKKKMACCTFIIWEKPNLFLIIWCYSVLRGCCCCCCYHYYLINTKYIWKLNYDYCHYLKIKVISIFIICISRTVKLRQYHRWNMVLLMAELRHWTSSFSHCIISRHVEWCLKSAKMPDSPLIWHLQDSLI